MTRREERKRDRRRSAFFAAKARPERRVDDGLDGRGVRLHPEIEPALSAGHGDVPSKVFLNDRRDLPRRRI